MRTCASCRFWNLADVRTAIDEEADFVEVDLPHRKCVAIIHGNGGSPDVSRAPKASRIPAMVCDGSGYAASLWTLPTFGCSLHEEKQRGR